MREDSGSSLVMFVMGMAVGAVAAALYTPVTGPALRRRLGQYVGEGAEAAQSALNQADEYIRSQTKAARDVVARAGEAFQKAREEVTDAAE